MPAGHRRKPVSGKQKKQLLKEKREKRANTQQRCQDSDDDEVPGPSGPSRDRLGDYTSKIFSVNRQPQQRGARANRYNLQFNKDKLDAEFARSKQEVYAPIAVADPAALEYSSEDFFPPGLTFPQRPQGYQKMTKETLEMHEARSVRLFAEETQEKFGDRDLNLYEQNTETWRQLWRVMDKSDVLLFIVDCRFAVCQFPPYVHARLLQEGRGVVLVLNKVDMMPAPLVLAWQQYFRAMCPGMQVVPFCSHERIQDRRRKVKLALHSCRALVAAVAAVAKPSVDLSSWREKLEAEALDAGPDEEVFKPENNDDDFDDDDNDNDGDGEDDEEEEEEEEDAGPQVEGAEGAPKTFTIGTIGYPNVGKSSLINAILGQHKVSVSNTPGHTKHFQTHFLTRDRSVLLCDCPGLIFPSVCPYKLQVLSGTFPISQVRSPMSVVGFLAAHINVPRALRITFPQEYLDDTGGQPQWTPFYIAEAWAIRRHFKIKGRGGRPDVSRAANELLRLSLTGRQQLVLCLTPPNYRAGDFAHEGTALHAIRAIQGVHAKEVEEQQQLLQYSAAQRTAAAAAAGSTGAAGGSSAARDEGQLSDDDQDSNEDDNEEEEKKSFSKMPPPVSNKFSALNLLEGDDDDSSDEEEED